MKKKAHTKEFKFKVALEAIKGQKTMAEICSEYEVVSSQVYKWKQTILEQGSDVFGKGTASQSENNGTIEKLHATIGRLKVENDFLEKVLGKSR